MKILQLDGKTISIEEQLQDLDRAEFEDSLYAFLMNG